MAITFSRGNAPVEGKVKVGRSSILYGPPFSGKTSTLQYDKTIRVLLIDLDKNSGVLVNEGNVDIIGIDSYEDLVKIREGVAAGKYVVGGQAIPMDYDLYVIDSFTTLEERIKRYVALDLAPNRKREIAERFGAQTDWDDLQRTEVYEFREWHDLTRRANNPINVLWIGHDMLTPDSGDFTKQIQLRLQGKYAAPGIMGATDGIFYMIKGMIKIKDKDVMGYGVYTNDTSTKDGVTYKAGARVPARERLQMPNVIWFPKWGEVYRTLGATNLPEVKKDEQKLTATEPN